MKIERSQVNKADQGKSNPLLLEVDMAKALFLVNRVLDYGVEKYTRKGWKTVEPERYDEALRRHRRDRDLGETRDQESGLLHLAHEACNILFLLQMAIEADPGADHWRYNKPPQNHKQSIPVHAVGDPDEQEVYAWRTKVQDTLSKEWADAANMDRVCFSRQCSSPSRCADIGVCRAKPFA